MTRTLALPLAFALLALPAAARADPSDLHAGTLITDYGGIADVPGATPIPAGTEFRVAFDTASRQEGTLNRTLTSAARFLNMHMAAGVPAERQHLAVVVHGLAIGDVASDSAGPNAPFVATLLAHGVRIIVCGQSAGALGVEKNDLLPGVEMALSAMTAHALLQGEGYTLNPF